MRHHQIVVAHVRSKRFELRASEGVLEGSTQEYFGRHSEQSTDVGTDVTDDEIRLRKCEQKSMRLDVPDDVYGLAGALVRSGEQIARSEVHHQRFVFDPDGGLNQAA